MSLDGMSASSNENGPAPRRVWRDVLVPWLGGLAALLASLLLSRVGGVVGRNSGIITAAYFLLVPVYVLRRQGVDPASFGISLERPLRALLWAMAVAVVVFPPYIAGYEVFARLTRGARLVLPEHPLTHFPQELRDRPEPPLWPGLHAWVEGERLVVMNTGDTATITAISGCACPARGLGRQGPQRCSDGQVGPLVLGAGQGVSCLVSASERLEIRTSDPPVPVLTGAGSVATAPGGGAFERTVFWLPELLLLHLFGVGLPEEVFYRGLVQTRLRSLFSRRFRLLGVEVGAEVPIASALFALSHLVTIQAPFRLAVFFPGLLFGWLRERTGSVLAPAILHAFSNVLLEVLVRYH